MYKLNKEQFESNFIFKDNHAEKLMIVFQSNGRLARPFLVRDYAYIKVKERHDRLTYFKLSQMDCSFDYLYVTDNFNLSYGYYTLDGDSIIINSLCKKIKEFISTRHGYVCTFGSSKGGFAALIFGHFINEIDEVFSSVPIIGITDYFSDRNIPEHHLKKFSKNNYLKFHFDEMFRYCLKNIDKPVKLVTGVSDDFYEETISCENANISYIIEESKSDHNDIIVSNIELIYKILFGKIKISGHKTYFRELYNEDYILPNPQSEFFTRGSIEKIKKWLNGDLISAVKGKTFNPNLINNVLIYRDYKSKILVWTVLSSANQKYLIPFSDELDLSKFPLEIGDYELFNIHVSLSGDNFSKVACDFSIRKTGEEFFMVERNEVNLS